MSGEPRFDAASVAKALGVDHAELLGSGSFGDTWRIEGAAVKIIVADHYPSARIAREVEGLGRVDSQFVVSLLRTEEISLGEALRPALYFEYIEGGDVKNKLDAADWPDGPQAIQFMKGLLQGVVDLHETGTVHRDLKPANIALRDGDWAQPTILDLGLARGIDDATITRYPGTVGTPQYMAPEQLRGERARKAADIFAAGVVGRHLAGRAHPFYEESNPNSFDEAIAVIDQGPAALPGDLPGPFVDLLDRMVSSAQHDRGSARSSLRRISNV